MFGLRNKLFFSKFLTYSSYIFIAGSISYVKGFEVQTFKPGSVNPKCYIYDLSNATWRAGAQDYEVMYPGPQSVVLKIIFLISQPKHMLWVLKRTVLMRRLF